MTWDECVPVLNTKKRLTEPDRPTPNRVVATYKIGDGAYKLTFERPAPPDVGPYRLVRIESSSTPAPGPSNAEITQGLRSGMTLDEALPLMRRIGGVAGGYFAMQTKDRFTAVLQTDDGNNIRVTFQRPKEVQRPDVIKDTPQDIVDKMGHIPLDALPEFGAYRVTSVETSKGR